MGNQAGFPIQQKGETAMTAINKVQKNDESNPWEPVSSLMTKYNSKYGVIILWLNKMAITQKTIGTNRFALKSELRKYGILTGKKPRGVIINYDPFKTMENY